MTDDKLPLSIRKIIRSGKARRVCPYCGHGVDVQTFPLAAYRSREEKIPSHRGAGGKWCRGIGMTMERLDEIERDPSRFYQSLTQAEKQMRGIE